MIRFQTDNSSKFFRWLAFLAGLVLLSTTSRAEETPSFNAVVRPILAKHCLKCHGPDDKTRKAGLRLDVFDSASKPAKSGEAAIVPGKPDASELVARIFSDDENSLMPPPSAKLPLGNEDKAILKAWVASGAKYETHWAFIPPIQSELPRVSNPDWVKNPIDAFILERLERAGLKPEPQADKATLIRRLSFDLIGLPPTSEEVDAFLGDNSPEAYVRLVDRLLASPQYGERWTRKWLDLARYADTNGYEKDRNRSIWPYRDWVIKSINADLPFDRFTIEQLAGDMLPNATLDQKIATGFHRNTMLNEEGGIDPLEFRFNAMTDRVSTTATVWLGITLGCAQCHTHKYDPIPHQDYYQFMAFLNNADEPELPLPSAEVEAKRAERLAEVAKRVAALPEKFPLDEKAPNDDARPESVRRQEHLVRKYQEWQQVERTTIVPWTLLKPTEAISNLPKLRVDDDGIVTASGDMSKSDTYTLKFATFPKNVTAIRLEVLPDPSLPGGGPGRTFYEGPKGEFLLSEFSMKIDGKLLEIEGVSQTFGNAAPALDGDKQSGWSINGAQGQANSAVFMLAEPIGSEGLLTLEMLFERYYAAGLGKFRIWATTARTPIAARQRTKDVDVALLLAPEARTSEQEQLVYQHYLSVAPELAKERAAVEAYRKQAQAYPSTLVMQERPTDMVRPTFVHNRGEYLQPISKVEPEGLSFLPAIPANVPRTRLGLAKWLVSTDNPLVGRVTMNRQWSVLFGKGLVRSVQDFGYQGETPTHPELLDWLAVEFAKQGWSMKAMHKMIVMSATYRQSSKVAAEKLAKDPENRLLSRGSRVRLEGETIRDAALRISGLLSPKIGGPSVFPPQPAGVSTEGAYGGFEWKPSPGEDRFRRSLYTFAKRTNPFAMLATFDSPSGEVCVARREVSNTPLQALTLMNDPVFIDASQALGRIYAGETGSVEERIDRLFVRSLARKPIYEERELLARFFEDQRKRIESKELDAVKIAGSADGDANSRASWTLVARAILNLDEAITKE